MFRTGASLWILFLTPLVGGLLLLPGCSSDSAPRSTLSVESINDNSSLSSDVYSLGADQTLGTADDNVPEEQVPIVVRNMPHDSSLRIRPNGPFSTVTLDRYEVHYSGDVSLPTFVGSIHLIVPSGTTADANLVVLPGSYKIVPPLSALVAGGEIHLDADVIVFGTEQDSGAKITTHATLNIEVANWADK